MKWISIGSCKNGGLSSGDISVTDPDVVNRLPVPVNGLLANL